MLRRFLLAFGSLMASVSAAQGTPRPPALDAIRASDIRRDIDILAGDGMRGREAGTVDEIRAGVWLADQFRAIGAQPAGEDGSYFQWYPLHRAFYSSESTISVDGRTLQLWRDIVLTPRVDRPSVASDTTLDVPLVFVGDGTEGDLAGKDVSGKAVVLTVRRPSDAPPPSSGLSSFRYLLMAMVQQPPALIAKGAAAVILVADSAARDAMPAIGTLLSRGTYSIPAAGAPNPEPSAPIVLGSPTLLDALRGGSRVSMRLQAQSFDYPSVNVIAKVPGTDPKLRNEYVLFSGHIDHDGVRTPVNGDSIWNGADDNASTAVALLAIARAWKRNPGKRSALFLVHGAEEKGLLGSRWHASRPVVPKESIVAVLDGDLMGRNAADSAMLFGAQPPHRTSATLVDMAMRANANITRFTVDTVLDRPTQPEQAFFRSDHLPYVMAGIPALFFSSWLHPDYHTPRDEPRLIDERKLARMTQWMYTTGWYVSQARERIRMDPGFKLGPMR